MKTLSTNSVDVANACDTHYNTYLAMLQERFLANTEGRPLFTTDVTSLWDVFLHTLGPRPWFGAPAEPLRQHYTCDACRRFVERFGGLVTIDRDGRAVPALWDARDAPVELQPAIAAMEWQVRRAKVTSVFLSSEKVWGTPETGVWRHMAVTPPAEILHKGCLTAGQAMAEKKEDFNTVSRALGEFKLEDLDTAVTLLRTNSLYRSEKVLGQAQWLRDLYVARASAHQGARDNVVWRAVASAPAGFCHPRSGMLGALLEDIASGAPYEDVADRFASKMDPLYYQRPQAAPSAGAIDAAEKLAQKLGIERSLDRRYARLDEVQALWRPSSETVDPAPGGVFGHLRVKSKMSGHFLGTPAQTMTWSKFQRTVLSTADRIEFFTPPIGSYTALVTAVYADAPPILQWDREGARNPVSWYVWSGGAPAYSFNVPAREFVPVDAVTLKPSMWNGGFEHQGRGVVFILAGARETKDAGSALFPEILKSDFHAARAVIEAHSKSSGIAGKDEPHAAGYLFSEGAKQSVTVRVWSGGRSFDYCLDRWD